MPRASRTSLGDLAFVAGLAVLAALPWAILAAARGNTLETSGRWVSAKAATEKGLIGGVMSRVTRPILARNQLDLGAWFGHQELHWREPVALRRFALRFQLEPGAHLSVMLIDADPQRLTARGFTLSRSDLVAGKGFVLDGDRTYDATAPLAELQLDGRWHEAAVRADDGSCTLLVDGREVGRLPCDTTRPLRPGLRGGAVPARVDDVTIEDAQGRIAVDDFDRFEAVPGYWIGAALLQGSLTALVLVIVGSRAGFRRAVLAAAATATVSGLLGLALLTLDHFVLAARYPEDRLVVPRRRNTLFDPDVPPESFEARFPQKAGAPRTRVLLLGGSQTWGSGATFRRDTWTYRLERRLNAALPARAVELSNRARSGHDTADIVRQLDAGLLGEVDPALVVVNASHNDFDVVAFGENLIRIWEHTQRHGARLAFVLEANSPEKTQELLGAKHRIMRELGAAGRIPVIDAHAAMATRHELGFLWWDGVHLTSAGQRQLADAIAPDLVELLR